MGLSILSTEDILQKLKSYTYAQKKTYLAMYSSWYGGIITDPSLMLVPVDDHLVHRGDGVFEAMKFVHGKVYLMQEHLDRLQASAAQLGLEWPHSREQLIQIIESTLKVAKASEAIVRLFLSRGPGGFTTNPYDSLGSQVYCVITQLKPMAEEKYQHGVQIGRSHVPPKDPWFATIKSCNYLHNVMMKKEAVDRKLDFTIGFDEKGVVTEGSTENIVLVDQNGILWRPRLRQILKGTTMMRALHLAESLVSQKALAGISEKDMTEADLRQAKEVMMIGTTLDALPVTSFEGQPIHDGKVGFVAATLRRLLLEDMQR